MPFIRSIHFVPGIQQRFIDRAPSVPADALCLDLEDSVPPAEKERGRAMVADALPTLADKGKLLFVRVNGLDTGLLEDDLTAIVGPWLDGISLPKAHSPEIVQRVDSYLTILEKQKGIPLGQVKMIVWIESAVAVMRAYQICAASPRLVGASLGAEDFTVDMGIQRTKEGSEVIWPRTAVAIACHAAGIQPIDTPDLDFRDLEHLEADTRLSRSLGYRGRYSIHPDQVPIVNRIYAPTEEEIEKAKRVIAAYEDGERQGLGAIALEGQVVDRPIYLRALNLLEWARSSQEPGQT